MPPVVMQVVCRIQRMEKLNKYGIHTQHFRAWRHLIFAMASWKFGCCLFIIVRDKRQIRGARQEIGQDCPHGDLPFFLVGGLVFEVGVRRVDRLWNDEG